MNNSENEEFTSFSIPVDGEMLKKLESSKLSDPHGPLGPLATTLGEAMYKITQISGKSKLAGDRAHFDFVIECSDPSPLNPFKCRPHRYGSIGALKTK